MMLQATRDIRKVALWLGHADIRTTEIYCGWIRPKSWRQWRRSCRRNYAGGGSRHPMR